MKKRVVQVTRVSKTVDKRLENLEKRLARVNTMIAHLDKLLPSVEKPSKTIRKEQKLNPFRNRPVGGSRSTELRTRVLILKLSLQKKIIYILLLHIQRVLVGGEGWQASRNK